MSIEVNSHSTLHERVLGLAIRVLENRQHAYEWLREPSAALGALTPLTAVEINVGAQKVRNVLYQWNTGSTPDSRHPGREGLQYSPSF